MQCNTFAGNPLVKTLLRSILKKPHFMDREANGFPYDSVRMEKR